MQRFPAILLLVAAGCTNGLPDYAVYVDLRDVAMVANPPEILLNEAGPLASVVSAVVVDPRGGAITYDWSLCPVQSDSTCDDLAVQVGQAPAEFQPLLQQLAAVHVTGTAQPVVDPNTQATFYNIPDFDIGAVFGESTSVLWDYFAASSLFNQGLGSWPSAILTVHSGYGDTLVMEKRIVLGVLDFAVLAEPLAQRFGITLCPDTGPPPLGCLALPAHVANSSPVFAGLQMAPGNSEPANFVDVTSPIQVKAGAQILLRPSFTSASYEPYFTIIADLDNQSLHIETGVEALSVSWFGHYGAWLNDLTWPKFTTSLDNVYTAPAQVPTQNNGMDTLYLVGRDQRGGEVWTAVQVQITAN